MNKEVDITPRVLVQNKLIIPDGKTYSTDKVKQLLHAMSAAGLGDLFKNGKKQCVFTKCQSENIPEESKRFCPDV